MKQYLFSCRPQILGALVAGVVFAAAGTPAQAALITTGSCNDAVLTSPFSAWGSTTAYELVPGGSFEGSTAGWTFTGGARTVTGSEPYGVTGSVGASSLYLPAGASAQSPPMCVNSAYPTFRFFGRNQGLLSTLLVEVVYKEPLVGQVAVPVGTVALTDSWQPSAPMLTTSVVQGLLSGGTAQLALRFTALTGASQVDDIFVDPRMHH